MLGFILIGAFVTMIGVIWFREGWKRALKIIGFWFGSFVVFGVVMAVFSIDKNSSIFLVSNMLLWGFWVVGLVFYNIKEGYIGNI